MTAILENTRLQLKLDRHIGGLTAVENYRSEFYPGPYKFDVAMQQAAFAWLKKHLV